MSSVEEAETRIPQGRQHVDARCAVADGRAQQVGRAVHEEVLFAREVVETNTLETPASRAISATVTASYPRSKNNRLDPVGDERHDAFGGLDLPADQQRSDGPRDQAVALPHC
jgi:hypothetical protein